MSEACGCGNDDRDEDEREPERLWEVSELRAAAAAGVLLLAGYVVGWADGPRSRPACTRWRWRSGLRRSCPPPCGGWPKARSGSAR